MDLDGLALAYKYFMCSTLTIRLCGIAQMNLQINAWSEFSAALSVYMSKVAAQTTNASTEPGFLAPSPTSINNKNELADWFVTNKIVEHLYGPNLHVEVIKRSQEIVNFLALTNRLNERHLDAIWSSAQLKHCSKPVMDTLMSLHKHLNVDSIQYLAGLIGKLDLSQQSEQTLLLSALLTKNLWLLILDWEDDQAAAVAAANTTTTNATVVKKVKSNSICDEIMNENATLNGEKNSDTCKNADYLGFYLGLIV